jgi:spermidine/putrescine transport system permease protein
MTTSGRRRLLPYLLLGPGLIWLALFFVVPLFYMGELSLRSGTLGNFVFDWDWANYTDSLSRFDSQFVRTFIYASVATVLSLLIAYPLAYAIAFRGGRWKNALLLAVVAPFFTTYLIRTIAWQTILGDTGFLVDAMKTLSLLGDDGKLLATPTAVIAGLTYNFLPFMILPIYASLERIDTSLIEAGKDLYASSTQTFLRVTLPITMPGIVAGVLLTFIPAVGDYINAEILGGTGTSMIGNVIQSLYLEQRNYPEAAALSFMMMAAILIVVIVYLRMAGTGAFMGDEDERD